jgi:hypothetical protein
MTKKVEVKAKVKAEAKVKGDGRRNPFAGAGGQDLDPAVRRQLKAAAVKQGDTEKVTIRGVPVEVSERIRQIAQEESNGRHNAFSEVAVAMLQHALDDYEAGRFKLKSEPVVVRTRLVAGK